MQSQLPVSICENEMCGVRMCECMSVLVIHQCQCQHGNYKIERVEMEKNIVVVFHNDKRFRYRMTLLSRTQHTDDGGGVFYAKI